MDALGDVAPGVLLFFICTSVSGSGLSMPTKIPKKFA
jgi:hypothetical protein